MPRKKIQKVKREPAKIPNLVVSFEDLVNLLGGPKRRIFSDRWEQTSAVAEILDRPNSCLMTEGSGTLYFRALLSLEKTCRKHTPTIYEQISKLRTHVSDLLHRIRCLSERSVERLEIITAWLHEMMEKHGFLVQYEIPFPWLNYTPPAKNAAV